MDQLMQNLKRLGAMDHQIEEQTIFDKSGKEPRFQNQDNNMMFEIQCDEAVVKFPLQWRGQPQWLIAEFFGVYCFLTAHLRVEGKRMEN